MSRPSSLPRPFEGNYGVSVTAALLALIPFIAVTTAYEFYRGTVLTTLGGQRWITKSSSISPPECMPSARSWAAISFNVFRNAISSLRAKRSFCSAARLPQSPETLSNTEAQTRCKDSRRDFCSSSHCIYAGLAHVAAATVATAAFTLGATVALTLLATAIFLAGGPGLQTPDFAAG